MRWILLILLMSGCGKPMKSYCVQGTATPTPTPVETQDDYMPDQDEYDPGELAKE